MQVPVQNAPSEIAIWAPAEFLYDAQYTSNFISPAVFAKKAWLSALPVQAAAADVGDAEGMADEDADGTSDGAAESDAEADSDADGSSVISTVGLGVGLSVGVALAVADGVGVETAAWVAVPVLQAAAMRHAVRRKALVA